MALDVQNMSLEDLKKQRDAFQQRIAEVERQQREEALKTVRELVARHKFSAKDIAQPVGTSKSTAEPKYRNPETGETWAGRGKPPSWLEGKNRVEFLISKATT